MTKIKIIFILDPGRLWMAAPCCGPFFFFLLSWGGICSCISASFRIKSEQKQIESVLLIRCLTVDSGGDIFRHREPLADGLPCKDRTVFYSPQQLSRERCCLLHMVLSWITATRSQQYAHCPPCRDIISRITLWWNWLGPLWMIHSDMGDLKQALSASILSQILWSSPTPEFWLRLSSFVAWSWTQQWAKLLLPTAASSKRNGQTHARNSKLATICCSEWVRMLLSS